MDSLHVYFVYVFIQHPKQKKGTSSVHSISFLFPDIYVVANAEGKEMILKLHRLGRRSGCLRRLNQPPKIFPFLVIFTLLFAALPF